MIDKKILLAVVGTNAVTATLCLGLASAVVRRSNKYNMKLARVAMTNYKAAESLMSLVEPSPEAEQIVVDLVAGMIDIVEFPK